MSTEAPKAKRSAPPEQAVRPRRRKAESGDTRTRLIEAAMGEFIEHGFTGTDTNRIARRAGFAPQTFYRWFDDKAAVFAEVLHVWDEAEFAMSMALVSAEGLEPDELAQACVENMRPFLTFRQHLRSVTMQDAEVKAVRAKGRASLMARIGPVCPHLAPEALAHTLLQIESLSEMLARGDLADMGVSGGETAHALAEHIRALRSAPV